MSERSRRASREVKVDLPDHVRDGLTAIVEKNVQEVAEMLEASSDEQETNTLVDMIAKVLSIETTDMCPYLLPSDTGINICRITKSVSQVLFVSFHRAFWLPEPAICSQIMSTQRLSAATILGRFFSEELLSEHAISLGKSGKGNTATLADR
jgi:hypothetical protein